MTSQKPKVCFKETVVNFAKWKKTRRQRSEPRTWKNGDGW